MRETRTQEFKETITNTFLKTVSAFSNYDGGTIYPRTESFQRRGGAGVFVEAGQQLVHTLQSAGILPLHD